MQVSVESPSPLERRVTVVVPVEQVEEAFNKYIIKLSKTATVNGFRKGKVPVDFIKQKYGQSARQDALSEVIQKSLNLAMRQEKLDPVDIPLVEPKNVVPGEPLEFTAIFEVLPEVKAINFSLTTVEKETAVIEESDIDKAIDFFRAKHGSWKETERPAQHKDRVIIDFQGSIDNKPIEGGEAKNYSLTLGENTMIPGFEDGLLGVTANEERMLDITFPEKYFASDVADKKAVFKIKVHSVLERILPELDEHFIKKIGIRSADLNELRQTIKKTLEGELERSIQQKLKNKVFDHLLEENPLEIPKSLIEREAERIHNDMHPNHKLHEHTQEETAYFQSLSRRNIALGMLIAVILKQHPLAPNPDRVKKRLEQIASHYENPDAFVKWSSHNKNSLKDIEMQVLEEQVVEKLLENVQVTEKKVSYNELIGTKP